MRMAEEEEEEQEQEATSPPRPSMAEETGKF
jgi:hypothetical protein